MAGDFCCYNDPMHKDNADAALEAAAAQQANQQEASNAKSDARVREAKIRYDETKRVANALKNLSVGDQGHDHTHMPLDMVSKKTVNGSSAAMPEAERIERGRLILANMPFSGFGRVTIEPNEVDQRTEQLNLLKKLNNNNKNT